MRKHYALIFACLISCCRLYAQDSLKTTLLDEVVTTAARYDQHILETPRSVTVINRDAIEKGVYNSVGELLSSQSGIYVVGVNQTPGTNQGLFMRGANSNQVAVMVDGSRLTDPSTPNATIDLNELSLTDIERIEIIRGSHSTLYGGGAVGGVVNIITRKGAAAGFHGNGGLQGGTFGKSTVALAENIGLTYTFKNGLYINGSLFNQNVKGLNASLDTLGNSGGYATTDQDDFRKTDVYVKTGFRNKTWDGFIAYKKIDQRADIDDGIYNDDDNAILAFERNLVSYQAGFQLTEKWRVMALGSWSNSRRLSLNDSSMVDEIGNYDATYVEGKYNGKIMTNEIQLNYQFQKLRGVLGIGQYYEDMDFNTYYFNRSAFGIFESRVNYDTLDTSARTNYAFGQVNMSIHNFDFAIGTRLSSHSLFGSYWTFDANPSYTFNNTLLYASVSAGFNPASLYQLYDPTKGFNAYTTRGNKNLKPEESLSLELGVKKEFQDGSHITLSAYRTETRNAIEYVYLWDKNTDINELTFADNLGDTYLNIAKQVVNGIELEGGAVFGKFYLRGNVTWLDGRITINPSAIDAQQTGGNHLQLFNYGSFVTDRVEIDKLVRRPAFTAYGELNYKPISVISLSAIYRYAGSRFDSGYDENLGPYGALNQFKVDYYHLVDLAARWQINKALSLGIKVENILNERYQEIIGFQTRGRSGYIKLNFRW